jgi:hypothetical protein
MPPPAGSSHASSTGILAHGTDLAPQGLRPYAQRTLVTPLMSYRLRFRTFSWGAAPHNGFTDLLRWRRCWWICFREGSAHAGAYDGSLRVLRSPDGAAWESVAVIRGNPGEDLRDPHWLELPRAAGVQLLVGVRTAARSTFTRAYQSPDGLNWDRGRDLWPPDTWLWRATRVGDLFLSAGYSTLRESRGIALYQSADGLEWSLRLPLLAGGHGAWGYPHEPDLLALPDGTLLCLVRRDTDGLGYTATALMGRSTPPYLAWTWSDLGVRIASIKLLLHPDSGVVVAGRLYSPTRSAILHLDPTARIVVERVTLGYGVDAGYAGAVLTGRAVHISDMAVHPLTQRSCIYWSRVDL